MESVVNAHVHVVLAKKNNDVSELKVNLEWNVVTQFFFEDSDVLSQSRAVKFVAIDHEKLVKLLLVERKSSDV